MPHIHEHIYLLYQTLKHHPKKSGVRLVSGSPPQTLMTRVASLPLNLIYPTSIPRFSFSSCTVMLVYVFPTRLTLSPYACDDILHELPTALAAVSQTFLGNMVYLHVRALQGILSVRARQISLRTSAVKSSGSYQLWDSWYPE